MTPAAAPGWTGGRVLAACSAVLVTGALLLQVYLSIEQRGLLPALWRLVAFFTILTNALVAAVSWALASGRTTGLAGPRVRLTAVNSIVLVGLIYVLLLQGQDHPQGLSIWTNRVFHWIDPCLFLLVWLTGPHGGLHWRSAAWAIVWPLGYCAYSMARGAIDGFYPYWFLDPAKMGLAQFALSFAILAAVFAGFASLFVLVDRRLAAGSLRGPDERG